MENPKYLYVSAASLTMYEFVSEGPKGRILKLVKYTEYGNTGIYNLGFGDKLGDSNRFDDKIISGNGDSEKILATVASTVYEFTAEYPDAFIIAEGSTSARTRLYRMGISNALEEINNDFNVFGFLDKKWRKFEPNQNYSAFAITKKQ